MKRPRLLITIILFTILVLSIGRVTVENNISTAGTELLKLQAKVDDYKKSNAILQEKYLEDSSLTKIASSAAQKGFIVAKNQVYLSTPLPLALKR
jgi:cell division protein FtsL